MYRIRKRHPLSFRPTLELLESRCLLANWPVVVPAGWTPRVIGTYGQYQDFERRVAGAWRDTIIHMHEGIDVPVTPVAGGDQVWAVADGYVEAIYRGGFDSFVVVRDGTPAAPGNLGWNYKHIVAPPTLQEGQAVVAEGPQRTLIGTMAQTNTMSMPRHLHLDRGPHNPNFDPNQAASARDPTIQNALQFFPEGGLRTKIRFLFPPLVNPLNEFTSLIIDQKDPTFPTAASLPPASLDFRLAEDDRLGVLYEVWQHSIYGSLNIGGGPFRQPVERRRQDARYFRQTLLKGGSELEHVGRLATATAFNAANASTGHQRNGNIDFVLRAYDQVGNGFQELDHLNPSSFSFTLTGHAFGVASGRVDSFNFSGGFPMYQGVGDFFSVFNTRAVYENDDADGQLAHDSRLGLGNTPDLFFYTLTNSRNQGSSKFPFHEPRYEDRLLFWNSDAGTGSAFAATNDSTDANRNSDARFPDDVYDLEVTANDLSGNQWSAIFRFVLTNWRRTIVTSKDNYLPNELISVTGGVNYRGNTNVSVYLIPAAPGEMSPLVDSQLPAWGAELTTNGTGEINPAPLEARNSGRYFVVADYNRDMRYTPYLDAFRAIHVRDPQRGRVEGRVWDDANDNGVQDLGENGIEAIVVQLFSSSGTILDSFATDELGEYQFEVDPGDYYLKVKAPYDMVFANKDIGDNAFDSDADHNGQTEVFTLYAADNLTIDAGLVVQSLGSISGTAWSDAGDLGIEENGEPGRPGVAVTLYTSSGDPYSETLTDGAGHYTFSDVRPGDYYVVFQKPASMEPSGPGPK